MKKIDKRILAFIGSLVVVILALFVYTDPFNLRDNRADEVVSPDVVSPEVISSRVISFIDESYVRGAAVIELIEVVKESGVYRVTLKIEGEQFDVFTTLDGKRLFPEGLDLENRVVFEQTIGRFTKTGEEVCLEDGKPIIYYFGRSDCPFCLWQQPVITEAMKPFEGYVIFKDHTDNEEDRDIFSRYSDGGVPLIVAGCSYFRVGAGGSVGDEDSDKKVLSALACKLTGGQPQEVCDGLEEIIKQI